MSDLRALAEKATPIYGGLYAVGEDGRVFAYTRWRGHDVRELVPTDDGHGYLRVRLTIDGKRFNAGVHRLVCAAFHGPRPSPFHEVRHLNGDKWDNRAANLAWGTRRDNAADRDEHGTTAIGERNGAARLTGEQVAAIRATYARDVVDAARKCRDAGYTGFQRDRLARALDRLDETVKPG